MGYQMIRNAAPFRCACCGCKVGAGCACVWVLVMWLIGSCTGGTLFWIIFFLMVTGIEAKYGIQTSCICRFCKCCFCACCYQMQIVNHVKAVNKEQPKAPDVHLMA